MAYNFQNGNNKIKLLKEYESVTQTVLLLVQSVMQNAKQVQQVCLFLARKQFYFLASG
jgi:hypothetical protein